MITASGRVTFSATTEATELLRRLVFFVEDMQMQGVDVRVDVTLGSDELPQGTPEDPKSIVYPGLPAGTFNPPFIGLVQPHVNVAGETTDQGATKPTPGWIDWGAHADTAAALDAGSVTWRKLPIDTRDALARCVALTIVRDTGTSSFTQADFEHARPTWMPGAASFPTKFGLSWPAMRYHWLAQCTQEAADDVASFRASGSGA